MATNVFEILSHMREVMFGNNDSSSKLPIEHLVELMNKMDARLLK